MDAALRAAKVAHTPVDETDTLRSTQRAEIGVILAAQTNRPALLGMEPAPA